MRWSWFTTPEPNEERVASFNWYHYQSLCKELLFFLNAPRIALLIKQSKRMDGADSPSLEKLKICLHFFCVHESTFAYTLCMLLFCTCQNCIHACMSVIRVHYRSAYECIQLHMNTFQTLQYIMSNLLLYFVCVYSSIFKNI